MSDEYCPKCVHHPVAHHVGAACTSCDDHSNFILLRSMGQRDRRAEDHALKSAPGILRSAADTMDERGKQYDQPGGERSMGRTVAAFNTITNRTGDRALSESEGWLLLQILKDVRDRTTKDAHQDSLVDGAAYSALKAEARLAGK